MKDLRIPKWAVLLAVAPVFGLLAADWVRPGIGTHLAVAWLSNEVESARVVAWRLFPLWGRLVGLVGKDVTAITGISVVAGLVSVWLVAIIFGTIFRAAIRGAKEGGAKGANEYPFVESAAMLLAGLAFALTPGFLVEATRISPLMVALVPPLIVVALLVKKRRMFALLALVPLAYSVYELIWARKVFLALAFPALGIYLALGVMPALVIAWCIRKRWILRNLALSGAFGAWALAILVMGATNFTRGMLAEGHVAYRVVSQIIANADQGGKIAIVSMGALDDLYFFMLPKRIRLLSLDREHEPGYGRALSAWVREVGEEIPSALADDLALAAELGPRVFLEEWQQLDRKGFEAAVACAPNSISPRGEREEVSANATIGLIAGRRGDYERAVRRLQRAVATGKASVAVKNDLAWALAKLSRYDEAEVFAREAVTDNEPRPVVMEEAERLWLEAREMPHEFIPDPETDHDYLAKVYGAAKLGHLEAMVKLGDYAFRRGALVEAYYWTALAELKGAEGLDEAMGMMMEEWMEEECPTEYDNAYDEFTEEQGSFARALLRIRCAVDSQIAWARMRELAEAGSAEAKLFLSEYDFFDAHPYPTFLG